MTYPTTFGTIPDQQSLGNQYINVYPTIAALALEQGVILPGAIVAVQQPVFQLLQAQGDIPASTQYVVASTASTQYAGGGLTTYWVPLADYLNGYFQVRAVITSISGALGAAYTGSTTGTLTQATASAIGTQDGITTLVQGDTVFLMGATVGSSAGDVVNIADQGPYVITVAGTASVKGVFVRPSWYQPGSAASGVTISVREGTLFGGKAFRSFAAKGVLSDVTTVDTLFYPSSVTQSVTLTTGFVTATNVPIRSLTATGIAFTPTNFSGAGSTVSYRTGAYASGGAATAIGYPTATGSIGSASASITALVAAGTFNTSDVGTGLLTITNW